MVHTALSRLLLAITEYPPFQQYAARTSGSYIIQSYIVLVSEYTDWWPNTMLLPTTQQTIGVQNHAGDNKALLAKTLSLLSLQYKSWGTNVQWYVQDAVAMTVLTCKTLPLSQGTHPIPQSTLPYNLQCPKPQDLTPQTMKNLKRKLWHAVNTVKQQLQNTHAWCVSVCCICDPPGGAADAAAAAAAATGSSASAGTATFCQSSPSSTINAIRVPIVTSALFSGFCNSAEYH